MEISISKAFSTTFSEKFNKTNTLIYAFIIIITFGIYYTSCIINKSEELIAVGILFYFIGLIFNYGYYATICNNLIHKKEKVMPSISEIKSILKNGFLLTIGNIGLSIIASFIIFAFTITFLIISMISITVIAKDLNFKTFVATQEGSIIVACFLMLFVMLYAIIIIYLTYAFILPLHLRFYTTLEIEDLFNITDAIDFRKRRKEYYCTFVLKTILMSIITFLITFATTIIITILVYVPLSHFSQEIQINIFSAIFGIQLVILCNLLIPTMITQIIGEVTNEEFQIEDTDNKIEFDDFDENLDFNTNDNEI